MHLRNSLVYGVALLCLCIGIFSLPIPVSLPPPLPQFEFFVQPVYAKFPLAVTETFHSSNKTMAVVNGTLDMVAKGALSVDNVITMNVTLNLFRNSTDPRVNNPQEIQIRPQFAFEASSISRNVPTLARVHLHQKGTTGTWTGEDRVVYFRSGDLGVRMDFINPDQTPKNTTLNKLDVVQITTSEVTSTTTNNALTSGIAFFVIAIALIDVFAERQSDTSRATSTPQEAERGKKEVGAVAGWLHRREGRIGG